MPPAQSTRESAIDTSTPYPTLLTIRIDLSKRCFDAVFRYCPFSARTKPMLCSCSQATAFLLATKPGGPIFQTQDCTRPSFVLQGPHKVKHATELCEEAKKTNGTERFISGIRKLIEALSKICSGEKTADTRRKTGDTNVRPFRNNRLDNVSVSSDLLAAIMAPLYQSEVHEHGLGYIYILRSQSSSNWAELKIGFSKYHPEHRAHQLASCVMSPEIVSHSPLLPHAKRLESIIHTELVSLRKKQFCGQCRRTHQEWFTISHFDAREVVTRWGRWMMLRPYSDGMLREEWRSFLSRQDLNRAKNAPSLTDFWDVLIDDFPLDESIESREEQVGTYLNAIWFERKCRESADQAGVDSRNKRFVEYLDMVRKMRKGRAGYGGVALDKLDASLFEISEQKNRHGLRSDASKEKEAERNSAIRDANDMIDHLISIETGGISVSHPKELTLESPLGDSTILPIVSLKQLQYVDNWTAQFIGYNPTNTGFQFLQEAYANGEWNGPRPRFKWTKSRYDRKGMKAVRQTHNARATRFSDNANIGSSTEKPGGISTISTPDQQARNNRNNNDESCKRGNDSHDDIETQRKKPKLANSNGKKENANTSGNTLKDNMLPRGGSSMSITPHKNGRQTTLEFSRDIDEDLVEGIEKNLEEIRNGGRANVEARFSQSLQRAMDQCRRVQRREETSTDDDTDSDESAMSSLSDPSDLQGLSQDPEDYEGMATSEEDEDMTSPRDFPSGKKKSESNALGLSRAAAGRWLAGL